MMKYISVLQIPLLFGLLALKLIYARAVTVSKVLSTNKFIDVKEVEYQKL